jgi:hypothetical protein
MTQQTTRKPNYFVDALVDAIAPIATYFALHALGVPPLVSMIAGTLIAVTTTVVHTIRRKRLDGVGVLVIAEIGVSILLQILVRDPRLLLIKPSFYTGIGAVYLLITAFGEHPLTYEGARPMATKGDPQRLAAYEQAWRCSPAFRALHRIATLGWSAALLADSVLRVVIVYDLPIDRAVWLGNVPHVAAIALLIGFSALVGRRARPLVEEQLRTLPAEGAASAPVSSLV